MAVVAYGIGLVLIWVLAWGTPTPANILGGLAVAAVLLVASPDTWPRIHVRRVHPVAIARLVGYVLVEAVRANVQVTRAILGRQPRLDTAVLAVPLPACSDGLVTLIANVMAVTPGTMPVEVTRDPTVIYVHTLLVGDHEEARRQIRHLADLAFAAFAPEGPRP